MSATIRKIVIETQAGWAIEREAFYIKEYHTINCTYIYHRADLDNPDSPIEYLFGIDDGHVDKFLALFNAEYIREKEHEFSEKREKVEEWECYAIRRASTDKPMTKAHILELMENKGVK